MPTVKSSAVQQKIVAMMTEVGFADLPPMATAEVRAHYEDLYLAVSAAVDVKRQLERNESDLRSLETQRNVLVAAASVDIPSTPQHISVPSTPHTRSDVKRQRHH